MVELPLLQTRLAALVALAALVPLHATTARSTWRVPTAAACSINGTQADCQLRSLSSVPAQLPNAIKVLHIDANDLSTMNGSSLVHLPYLRAFLAKLCRLHILPPGLFTNLPYLDSVDLSFNLLRHLEPETFSSNPRLQVANFAFNNLENITSETFRHNTLLRQLNLSFNELNTLPEDSFVHLTSLEHLILQGNGIRLLPGRLFVANIHLSFLDLSDNDVTTLEATVFKRLKRLRVLNLSDNKLQQLEPTLFDGNYLLSELNIHGNRLSSLSSQLLNVTQISHVSLSSNPWHCDCVLKHFLQEVHSRGALLTSSAECATPRSLAKKDIINLFHRQVSCNATSHQTALLE